MDDGRNNGCSGLIATILVNDCNSSRSVMARGEDTSLSLILRPLLTLLNDHSLFWGEMRCIYAGLRRQKWHTWDTYKGCCRRKTQPSTLASTSPLICEAHLKATVVKWHGMQQHPLDLWKFPVKTFIRWYVRTCIINTGLSFSQIYRLNFQRMEVSASIQVASDTHSILIQFWTSNQP